MPPPPRSSLFAYTTLFRSRLLTPKAVVHGAINGPRASRRLPRAPRPAAACSRHAVNTRPLDEVRAVIRSEEHTSELQSHSELVCRLRLEKKNTKCPSALIR